jgi:hypothetical protein
MKSFIYIIRTTDNHLFINHSEIQDQIQIGLSVKELNGASIFQIDTCESNQANDRMLKFFEGFKKVYGDDVKIDSKVVKPKKLYKGLIYIIRAKNDKSSFYIGSTTIGLDYRIQCHKSTSKSKTSIPLYEYIRNHGGWNEMKIKTLKCYEAITRPKLLRKERKYLEAYQAKYGAGLNRVSPQRSQEETKKLNCEHNKKRYHEDPEYRELVNSRAKASYARNRDKKNEKHICPICLGHYTNQNKKTHESRDKHQRALKSQLEQPD